MENPRTFTAWMFPPSRRDREKFVGRYQTLRVWLISGCASGTNFRSRWRFGAATSFRDSVAKIGFVMALQICRAAGAGEMWSART